MLTTKIGSRAIIPVSASVFLTRPAIRAVASQSRRRTRKGFGQSTGAWLRSPTPANLERPIHASVCRSNKMARLNIIRRITPSVSLLIGPVTDAHRRTLTHTAVDPYWLLNN